MAGYKNKSKSSSKGRKVKSKSKSKSKSSPVPVQQQTIEIGNETLVTTVRALAQAGGGFANMLMTALAAAVAGAGGQPLPAGTRFVIQPWAPAGGYESSSSSEDDDYIAGLLAPNAFDRSVDQIVQAGRLRPGRIRRPGPRRPASP